MMGKQRVIDVPMTLRQARVLMEVLLHVGGDPDGPRGQMDQLADTLDKLKKEDVSLRNMRVAVYGNGSVCIDKFKTRGW